ncbi:MAG: hypothetical protein QOH84_6342 [Kribbellaceae bacterium]|nr:hypothetical protein [Kribbellaceae bacterium]
MSGPAVSPQLQPPPSHRDAKATAKAAKAYAKAQRPWYKKKRFIGLGALIVIIVIVIASNNGGSTSTTPPAAQSTAAKASAPKASAPASAPASVPVAAGKALPIQNGDWRLDSIRIKDDGLGDFGGVARVTYTGDDKSGGTNLFTLTVFKAGKDIAVLSGSATSVLPGTTATVQFIGGDKFVAGPYTYDFQNDL